MAIVIVCPKCSIRLTLDNDRAGTSMDCPRPRCNTSLSIPATPSLDPLPAALRAKYDRLRRILTCEYLVEPCSRCLENQMRLVEISPNARSVCYKCAHCGKRTRSAAGSKTAAESIALWKEVVSWVEEYNQTATGEPYQLAIEFETPAAPLPYEQTTRSPIPKQFGVRCGAATVGNVWTAGRSRTFSLTTSFPSRRAGPRR